MEDLAKLTASGRKFEIDKTAFHVKPVKIKFHNELKEDSKSLTDLVYLQLEDETQKKTLFKWIERQFVDENDQPITWDILAEAGATYEDVRNMLMSMFQDSGF